ncbi:MAG: fatty acyl-AMP ligase [Rhizobiales bacterium]|nr:fatty acyl-AMP ligase [Hyphomicrobiales bacterium]
MTQEPQKFLANNWIDILYLRSKISGDKKAFIFLSPDGKETERLTFSALLKRSEQIAAMISEKAHAGQNCVIFLPQGLNFVCTFFGILLSGCIPVPAFAPNAHRNNSMRMAGILEAAKTNFIVTDSSSSSFVNAWKADGTIKRQAQCIEIDVTSSDLSAPIQKIQPAITDTCLLQFTSGSTGEPKGVLITHENLLENMELLVKFYGTSSDTPFVSWVPLYHDLGLIGNMLFPIYSGATCIMMAPESFIQRPSLWLETIDKYRAYISFAPTFAYQFATKFKNEMNLTPSSFSSWKVAVVGAEPIFKDVLDTFSEAFSEFGFSSRNFQCAYGLAESTLMVVSTSRDQAPNARYVNKKLLEEGQIEFQRTSVNGHELICSGCIGEGHSIRIVDPNLNHSLNDLTVGEIYISGPCIADGYYENKEATENAFVHFTEENQIYLRTGDLGFLDNSELYVTGRSKDLIIINGKNHYPQDIEKTIYSNVPFVRVGCTTAFQVQENSREQFVLVSEIKPEHYSQVDLNYFTKILRCVYEYHGLTPLDIVLIPAGHISKTSSGKLQRQLVKKRYQNLKLKVIANLRS